MAEVAFRRHPSLHQRSVSSRLRRLLPPSSSQAGEASGQEAQAATGAPGADHHYSPQRRRGSRRLRHRRLHQDHRGSQHRDQPGAKQTAHLSSRLRQVQEEEEQGCWQAAGFYCYFIQELFY